MLETIPQPKYKIGDTVYVADAKSEKASHPCPDCLGTRKWEVHTPGGETFQVECQRCPSAAWLRISDIPSLEYSKSAPVAKRLTIGSIRIDTANERNSWGNDVVQYMCHETGIGSGSVWDERRLHASEEEAMQVAIRECDENNARNDKTPERVNQIHGHHLTLCNALVANAKKAESDAKYRLRYFKEDIADKLKDESLSDHELRDGIRSVCGIEKDEEEEVG